ncbi:MAG TPA: hypothetical protein VG478_02800, partial [Acidimicrobiales bacterium]|nr:hypothetical protein [Acidimicrobiales bacterium]
GFGRVISIIGSPHNLHNYDELGVAYLHRPFLANEDDRDYLAGFYPELHELLQAGTKVLVHGDEVGDRVVGLVGGYIRWAGFVTDGAQATVLVERIAGRQLDPLGRQLMQMAAELGEQNRR